MIVISAGLQKSGTAWFFNLTNDLLAASGGEDVRCVRERYGLDDVLLGANCRLRDLEWSTFARLARSAIKRDLAVKTHGNLSAPARRLLDWGLIKATYIYRDPRDVALSALRHGLRLRQQGRKAGRLDELDTIEAGIERTAGWLSAGVGWRSHPKVFRTSYEDLVQDPKSVLGRLLDYLAQTVTEDTLAEVVASYEPSRLAEARLVGRLHFDRGEVGAFRREMTAEQIERANRAFAPHLEALGYAVD